MVKLSNKILNRIKKEKVTPKPRWYFILIHTLLGTAILSSMIIGSIAVAIIIRHCTLTDWELAHQFTGGHLHSFFMFIPYIWIIFIGFSILLADLLFKHTKKGYRIEPWKIISASIVLSIIGGGLFFITKADKPIENELRKNIPPYVQWEKRRNRMFIVPEKGALAGELTEIKSDKEWILIDFKNKQWSVDVGQAKTHGENNFKPGIKIGILGKMIDEKHFQARQIKLWRMGENSHFHRKRSLKK